MVDLVAHTDLERTHFRESQNVFQSMCPESPEYYASANKNCTENSIRFIHEVKM